jgi:predicted dehydrogenase
MPGTLRWGILGPGGIAESQVKDLLQEGFAVTAVGSRSLDRAQEFADRFGIPTVHGSYEALVADPGIDIVYVATPHSGHYEHARLALDAGKHVLVEKAFTVTAPQAQALVDLAAAKGLVILEAMWTRFLPHMVRLREVLADGLIGEVRSVIADHSQRISSDPQHRLNNPDLAGGALLDLGIYPVSFAWDVFGAPETVDARAAFTETGVDRQTGIHLTWPGGRQAMLHTELDTVGPNSAVVMGTEGWIQIDPVWYNATGFTRFSPSGEVLERFDGTVAGRGMQFQAMEVERLVEAGLTEGTILPPSESVAIMGTLDEVRRLIGLEYPAEITDL